MKKKKKKKRRARLVVESQTIEGILYQRELVQCGKCKQCRLGPVHGPYWYAYRWSQRNQRLVSKYVGKELEALNRDAEERKDRHPTPGIPTLRTLGVVGR